MRWPLLVSLLLLGGCAEASGPQVTATDARTFDPATITIEAGESVMWLNESGEQHTVTAYEAELPEGAPYFSSGGLDSEDGARAAVAEGLFGPGDAVSIGFRVPGTYRYFCIPHEDQGMKGSIVVEG